MQLSQFNFPFDASLIATEPVLPREQAGLLVLTPRDRSITIAGSPMCQTY
jgi:S-adenosylmethionine:tRNA-ribosyltransferase-isomerase (queuine synthetase)